MANNDRLMNAESYGSYGEFFEAFRNLASQYSNMPADSVWAAYNRAVSWTNPFVQNSRVKRISSFPVNFTKDQIVKFLQAPNGNERALRQVAHGLEWTAYPYFKIRKAYQGINTYRYFTYPLYLDGTEDKQCVLREWRLLDKLNHKLRPEMCAHKITGQALQEGKVCYVPRYKVDKPHNKVDYAMLQQLPSDFWKITGYNSESGYTVMFDMMWLLTPGADWRQFGDLLIPYLEVFEGILEPAGVTAPKDVAFAKARDIVYTADGRPLRINMKKFAEISPLAPGDPLLYNPNGRWAYWVTLPTDRAWVFEIDDTKPTVAPPLTGLFLAFDQIAALEEVQLQVSQNTLTGVVLGEIPYHQTTAQMNSDQYKLSPSGRKMFLQYWYDMAASGSVWGTGAYFAPVENLHMETFAADPNAANYSSAGYAYAVEKSGLAGLIPVNDNPRAGVVNISALLEENYCKPIYWQFQRMMETIYDRLNLRYEWGFRMFGGFSTDEKRKEAAKSAMTLGYLPALLEYNALNGNSLIDDMSLSGVIEASGIMELRKPLTSSYNTPASGGNTSTSLGKVTTGTPGRPKVDITEIGTGDGSEGQEDDLDNGGED